MSRQKHISQVRFDRLKVAELRILCLECGLPENGLKRDLVKRLTTWRKGKQGQDGTPGRGVPTTPESLDTCEPQASVAARAEIGNYEHIISSAQKNRSDILENNSFSVDRNTPTLTVATSHGHAWATVPGSVKALDSKISSLRKEISSLRERVGSNGVALTSLQGQVTNLTLSVPAYALIRHCFLVNYKRMQMGIMDQADQRYICDRNTIAHGGDVKADAELYKVAALHRRDDVPVFKSLYGCIPLVIWQICKQSLPTEITSL